MTTTKPRLAPAHNQKSKIKNQKSPPRRGVVLLLVVSLLALFILLGVTFTIVALQALNASKLEIKQQQVGDLPETEMDLVLGQLLYDTQARTVIQYHSLLRDFYGHDGDVVINASPINTASQFRESFSGVVLPTSISNPGGGAPPIIVSQYFPQGITFPAINTGGGQLYTFAFALQPFPLMPPYILPSVPAVPSYTQSSGLTKLSDIPNYYAGRVLTFSSGKAANLSARIVSYQPMLGYLQHQPNPSPGTSLSDGTTKPPFFPPYGLMTIEALDPAVTSALVGGEQFVVNGAPFNGAGAGYDPITRSIDATIAPSIAAQAAAAGNTSVPNTFPPPGYAPLIENPALLPNYASYDANNTSIVLDVNNNFNSSDSTGIQTVGNKKRAPNAIGLGGLDEPWDAPDLQNMYLAMIPPRAAENYFSPATPPSINPPIIPSFHRPELVNFWVNFIREQIFENENLGHKLTRQPPPTGIGYQGQLQIMAFPYGLDRIRGTADDPLMAGSGGNPLTLPELDRIYTIMHGCLFRPMPWDHPNFTGSNPNNFPTLSSVSQLVDNFNNIINSPLPYLDPAAASAPLDNRLTWDVDNDNDGIPDAIWIDPGLPIITLPNGRRAKRLAAITIKDLDGLVNLNAHGNLQEARNNAYRAGNATNVSNSLASNITGGLASGADVARGLGYGPGEVTFYNMLASAPADYTNLILGRYISNRVYPANQLIFDNYNIDYPTPPYYKGTNLPLAGPGIPYRRDWLTAIKSSGIPIDYSNSSIVQSNYYASPPDIFGRGAVVLDYGGKPVFVNAGQKVNNTVGSYNPGETVDSPYDMALNGAENGTDSPYTAAELELLLRYHDPDAAQLPKRLISLAASSLAAQKPGVIGGSHSLRNAVSTMSSDVPTPATSLPPELRALVAANASSGFHPGASSILDLYYAKLAAGGLSGPTLTTQMRLIAPWEFFKGQKFDINRPFGDGVDSDFDGAPDSPREYNASGNTPSPPGPVPQSLPAAEYAWAPTDSDGDDGQSELPPTFYNVSPRYGNSVLGTAAAQNQRARQLYARHLFCMALLFVPDNTTSGMYNPDFSGVDANLTAGSSTNLYDPANQVGRWIIRRIAQWAVNCADFRDQDSIMTGFEFDYNPWDGWNVDGDLTTSDGNSENLAAGLAQPGANRGLVWGMESPDLLITETLAFHDRRCKDTNQGGPGDKKRSDPMMPDDDLDQFRIPQGSVFVELYCPSSPYWSSLAANQKRPRAAGELYASGPMLNLAKTTGTGASTRPVWRLAFARLDNNLSNTLQYAATGDPSTNTPGFPQTVLTDPTKPNYMPSGTPLSMVIDRFAYFTNGVPSGEGSFSFYNSSGSSALLSPGGYAVIGPRDLTYLGSKDPTAAGTTGLWGGNSAQYIQLKPTLAITNTSGAPTTATIGTDMFAPLTIVCDMPAGVVQPTGWSNPSPWGIGLNVTEPLPVGSLAYYPEPIAPSGPSSTMGAIANDFYGDPDDTSSQSFKEVPVESALGANAAAPIVTNNMLQTGTYEAASCVLLQRLADPTQVYNPDTNPYIVVDWSSIDVTVFNGEEDSTRSVTVGMTAEAVDPLDQNPNRTTNSPLSMYSRQRGYLQSTPPTTATNRNSLLWPPAFVRNTTQRTPLPSPSTGTYFGVNLSSMVSGGTTYDPSVGRHTLGWLNSTLDYPYSAAGGDYTGDPATTPFPWFNWNNRPFTNALELFSVPASAPSRAFLEMTPQFPAITAGSTTNGPYYDKGSATPKPQDLLAHAPYGHLLNFFQSASFVPGTPTKIAEAPHLYRLLDFVEVPSPFAGTERWFNPQYFQITPTPPNPLPPDFYWAPFNKLSRFRDPGKLNINTIFDPYIWEAATSNFPGMRATDTPLFFNTLGLSRRGGSYLDSSNPNPTNWWDKHPYLPTRFANPMRTADTADMMPMIAPPPPPTPPSTVAVPPLPATMSLIQYPPANALRKQNAVEATLLRQSPDPAAKALDNTAKPLLETTWTDNFRNSTRNPYFRYQAYQKLGNILTTRSNCFAVWITIGYFEIEENRPNMLLPLGPTNPMIYDAAHPDGYCLAQEIGLDTGTVTRHRGFFIIDRSVPVGFSPGSRLNTDDCVLVRRLIE